MNGGAGMGEVRCKGEVSEKIPWIETDTLYPREMYLLITLDRTRRVG